MKLTLAGLADKINSDVAAGLLSSLAMDGGAITPHYSESATDEQKAAAQAMIDAAEIVDSLRTWTPYEFYTKFTADEKSALLASADKTVMEFRNNMQLYQSISPDSDEMENAMAYLVSIGILTETRKQEILA